MKNVTFTLILSLVLSTGFSQTFDQTHWTVYTPNGDFVLYFIFENDTVSYSQDNSSFTQVSAYAEIIDTIFVSDIPFAGNCGIDTGVYKFNIRNDTCYFTLIEDNCPTRVTMVQDNVWIRTNTGSTLEIPFNSSMELYPNPTNSVVHIRSKLSSPLEYRIIDNQYRTVAKGQLLTAKEGISVDHLNAGRYVIEVLNQPFKISSFIKF